MLGPLLARDGHLVCAVGLCLVSALAVAPPATATTKVVVLNHTSKTIRLPTTSNLASDYWTAGVDTLEPWTRGVAYETNRDEGVGAGETFLFETRLDAVAWRSATEPPTLRVRLVGALVGSSLAYSIRDATGHDHPWVTDREARTVPWALHGATLHISVQAAFAGTEDDLEIVLTEPRSPPRGSRPEAPPAWHATHLDVLTYNVYMRPRDRPPYAFLNGQDIRAALLAPHLDGYDVLVLQELFEDSSRDLLLAALADRGYHYATAAVGDDVLTFRWVVPGGPQLPKSWNGGVVIVSRWPFLQARAAQVLFGAVCSGMDCGADKGAVYVTIDKALPGAPPLRFHLVGTHLNNGDWPTQRRQLELVRALIDRAAIPADEPLIIAGDFNIDRVAHPDQYRDMLAILSARDPCPSLAACGHPFTADPLVNDLLDDGGERARLDYVLYSTRHLPTTSGTFARTRVPRAATPWREFPHEPAMWDLSDHFPVYGSFLFGARPRAVR